MESEHVKQLKQQRATAKRRFTRKVNIFRESVCQEDPLSVLQHNYGEVSHAYIEVENIHEKYVELLSETTTDEALIEDEDQYIMDIERKRNDSHALLAKKSDQQLKVNVSKAKVKVKALDPPVFNGDIREYPAFKADFERLMNDSFGKDPFALKQCLSGDALKAVKGVETDYDQMFKRLDEKYGNCRKIVDVVLCDLKSLRKISDGDSKGFVKMVEKVERCWLDLKRMNLASEMNTSNTVSHIEKILPMTQKREWVILAEDITDPQKIFEELLEFLLKEKRVLEYMDSSIRSTVSLEKVNIHSINGSHGPDLGVPNGSCEIVEAIKKLQENQECQNKKLEQCPDMTRQDVITSLPNVLTKRMILRQVASIYDPLGLVTPFTLQAKLLIRKLVTQRKDISGNNVESIGWDDPLPNNLKEMWKTFFLDLYDLETLSFKRCLKPVYAEGNPILIVFSDGSTQAYGTCAYLQWKLKSGQYEVKLIAAKGRIAPSRQLTIPRLELCGAVLACRLREMIVREFDWTFDSVIHIIDSAIVRAQIQKESYGFSTFVATRIAEIQTKSSPGEWWWVQSDNNPADLTTKSSHPYCLGIGSVWQNGPDYLHHAITSWPISRSFCDDPLPDRIVYIDLAEGYSTEDFLTTFRRFVALRGFPRMIHSDGGSQLVAASKELRQIMSTWNMSDIIQFGSNEGLSWSFNKAADAPWQNGCSEALIKVIKRSIMMSIGDSVLTFGELQTVLFEVANLTNERPIGIKPGTDLELGNYLCPNDLLLGRASIKVPSGAWDNTGNSKHRLEFIQKIVTNFWRRWQRDYFPTLIVRQKWHVSKRNVKVGDIVLLQESNAVIGKWKLAQVVLVIPGHDDKVRNVTLRYKIQKPDKKYNGEPDMLVNRSVHRLVVLLPIEEQCT
ncbi:hypothetical protein Pmani_005217 [Petrolisthes manimaculis]|uniref:Integrase catalytic domain-containing protein n=1 Tax=Petrolisthes manimaculis TaxID=1843537 RepID=A0AAE1UMI1_9EUCA|nr:hypothetical protein Pmani_005217 [Petrolisthes manimaculis]